MGMTKMEHRLYAALIAAWTRGFRLLATRTSARRFRAYHCPATDEDIADRWRLFRERRRVRAPETD
jgi:hypothetical protein